MNENNEIKLEGCETICGVKEKEIKLNEEAVREI